MSLMLPRMTTREKMKVVKAALRTVRGSTSATPTPVAFRVPDVGLLYFLNQKQAQLHEAVAALHFSPADEYEMASLRNLLEFMRYIVGGLIVEAERIDEALISVQKEVANVATELRRIDVDLQHQRPKLGTHVDQAIAQHYQTVLAVPQRTTRPFLENLNTLENQQLGDIPTRMVALRAQLRYLREHQTALTLVQRLLHGNGSRIPESEAMAIVSEVDIAATFRKSIHKARDTLVGVKGREDLVAIHSLIEFFDTVVQGIVGAMASVIELEHSLMKQLSVEQKTKTIAALDVADARNKKLSAEALQLNEVLSHQVLGRTAGRSDSIGPYFAIDAANRDRAATSTHNPSLVQFLAEYCA